MYAATDPRAALNKEPAKAPTPTAFQPSEYARFYDTPPGESGATAKTWYVRGQNMIVVYTQARAGCSDEDIRDLVGLGVKMEHSICMFVEGRAHKYGPDKLAHLIEVAGVDNTLLCSDLGLQGSPRPVDGYRSIVGTLLDLQFGEKDIRKLVGKNAAQLL
jgi:hypothetical protein